MGFFKLAVQGFFRWTVPILPDKQRQVVLINPRFFIKIIVPDKTAFFPVFRNRRFPKDFFIFVSGIQIKNKNSSWIQVIIDQGEYLNQIFIIQNVIHGIADADHCPNSPIKFKFPHILKEIQDVAAAFQLLFHCNFQHFLCIVHANHIISGCSQKFGKASGSAAQIQYQAVLYAPFF